MALEADALLPCGASGACGCYDSGYERIAISACLAVATESILKDLSELSIAEQREQAATVGVDIFGRTQAASQTTVTQRLCRCSDIFRLLAHKPPARRRRQSTRGGVGGVAESGE